MTNARFFRYALRTTDVDAARAFYTDLLGPDFWGDDVFAGPIPAPARARGAPPHWLGSVGPCDVDTIAAQVLALGGEQLGPTTTLDAGTRVAVLRDPSGAVLAVCSDGPPLAARPLPVAWRVLHTRDEARALAGYASLFGWSATDLAEVEGQGRFQSFAWDDGDASVGSVSDAARRPGIHPQWLFFFAVGDVETALTTVRARGGLALDPVRTPAGALVVACDDPQGAAFGLVEVARPAKKP